MFSSSQIQALFYHSRNKTQAFHGNLDTKSVREAIILHPVKQPSYMYRLHSHFMTLRTHDLLRRAIQLQESSRKWTDNSTWAQGCFLLVKRKPPIRTWEQLELFRNLGHVQHTKAKNLMIKCSMQKSFIVPEWTRSYHLTVFSQLDSENTHSSQTARQTHFTGHAHSWLGSRAPGLVWEVWERLRVIWNIPRPGCKKKLETSRNFCNCSLFFGEFFSHRHCCLYC